MKTDFENNSSKFGLLENEFSYLDIPVKKKLLKLIARIMEKAYRRGVQQTLYLKNENSIDEWITEDPYAYRYDKSLDISIGLTGFTTTSFERLMMEENLEDVGLMIESN